MFKNCKTNRFGIYTKKNDLKGFQQEQSMDIMRAMRMNFPYHCTVSNHVDCLAQMSAQTCLHCRKGEGGFHIGKLPYGTFFTGLKREDDILLLDKKALGLIEHYRFVHI